MSTALAPRQQPAAGLIANLAVAGAYAAAGLLSFLFGLPPSYISPVYPPSGIAVAAFLLLGPRVLPGIWLGNLTVSGLLMAAGSLDLTTGAVALVSGVGAVAETLVAGWVMQRFAGANDPFEHPRHVVVFLLGASLLAGIVGAALGTAIVRVAGLIAPAEIWSTAAIWLLGDAAGIAIFAPLILAWRRGGDRELRPALLRTVPAILLAVLAVAAAEAGSGLRIDYLYLPVVVWAGFRAGPRGATLATALVCLVTIVMTAHGRGRFAGGSTSDALLLLEGFIAIVTTTGLIVCATRAEQAAAEAALAEHNRTLERRVADRTAELVRSNRLLAEKQQRIDGELVAAHALQAGILPTRFGDIATARIAALARPAFEMSGDFYDVFQLAPGRHGIVIADVAGKGVAAAFFMAMARSLVRNAASRRATPARRIAAVNDELCRDNPLTLFITLFYAELDEAAGELTCVNAGHNPPILLGTDGHATAIPSAGDIPLGIIPGTAFKEHRLPLRPGEALLLYTDGITESADPAGELYGEPRLLATLARHAQQPPAAQIAAILQSLDTFADGTPQADDITCLLLQRIAGPDPSPPPDAGSQAIGSG